MILPPKYIQIGNFVVPRILVVVVDFPKSIIEATREAAEKHLKWIALKSKMIRRAHRCRQAHYTVVWRADRSLVHREAHLKLPPTEFVLSRRWRHRSIVPALPLTPTATKLAPNVEFN